MRFRGDERRPSLGGGMDQVPFKPELACPRCGYNVVIQIEKGVGRCPECGLKLPDVKPGDTVSWHIAASQMRRELQGY